MHFNARLLGGIEKADVTTETGGLKGLRMKEGATSQEVRAKLEKARRSFSYVTDTTDVRRLQSWRLESQTQWWAGLVLLRPPPGYKWPINT